MWASEMTRTTPEEAARDERAKEGRPERPGLGRADLEADDLTLAALVDGDRDQDGHRDDPTALPDLGDLGATDFHHSPGHYLEGCGSA